MLFRAFVVSSVFTCLCNCFTFFWRGRQCEVLWIQIANASPQPNVKEGGEVCVEYAAVIRRVGDDCVESRVFVEQAFCVASGDDRFVSDGGEFTDTENFVVDSHWQTPGRLCEWVYLREIVNHLQS